MSSVLIAANSSQVRRKPSTIAVSKSEIFLTLLALGVGLFVIITSEVDYAFNTVGLLLIVTLGGFLQTKKTAKRLYDPKLQLLSSLWLFKVFATILLLYWGWMPELDPFSSGSWGYDPQRFYQYSWDLATNDWVPDFGLNYLGITYYYGAIFSIFGRNPIIPALINIAVTLLGILFLLSSLYLFTPNRRSKDWRIAYLLLIPEVLWYDVMTSRETLMAVLILAASLVVGRSLTGLRRISITNTWLLGGTLFFAIIAVRPTMIVPQVASVLLMVLFIKRKKANSFLGRFFIFVTVACTLSAGPVLQEYFGGHAFDYLQIFDSLQSFEGNIASRMEGWSEQSIGMLLMPNNFLQSLLFLPFRMVLYLAAPLPKIGVHISNLLSGSWEAWQRLMTVSTSTLMLLLFPYLLAGTSMAWTVRRNLPAILVVPIAFWINFAGVAGGNLIIHERYRLMVTLLFFACVWIGYTRSTHGSVRRWAMAWFGFLGLAASFYMGYKFF